MAFRSTPARRELENGSLEMAVSEPRYRACPGKYHSYIHDSYSYCGLNAEKRKFYWFIDLEVNCSFLFNFG